MKNRFNEVTYDNILLDFLNQMNDKYRTNGKQAIGGISRGGFWAYQIGLRFPDQFVAIGGHSPFFDRYHAPPEYNPLNLADTLTPDTHLKLWLDRGSDDYASDGIERMHTALDAREIPHQYTIYPGGIHAEQSWSSFIDDYLTFYVLAFENANDGDAEVTVELSDVSDDGNEPETTAEPTEIVDEAEPEVTAEATEDEFVADVIDTESKAVELWIPAGGFPTLNTSVTGAELEAMLNGERDERLILTAYARDYLTSKGFTFHSDTFVTTNDTLE